MKRSSRVISEIEALPDDRARARYLRQNRESLDRKTVAEVGGMAYDQLGADPARALMLAQVCEQAARLVGDGEVTARALDTLGAAHHRLGRYEEAVVAYRSAAEAFDAAGLSENAIRTRIALVDALTYLSRFDEALAIADRTRSLLRGTGLDDLRAMLAWNEGNVQHRLDRYPEALRAYERARRVHSRRGNLAQTTMIDLNRAVVLTVMNEHQKALRLFRRARKVIDAHGQTALRAQLDYNLAYLHFLRGRYSEALGILDRVRDEFDEMGDRRHVALCDMDRSEILLRLNLPREAEEIAAAAAASFREIGMRIEEGKSRVNAAVARFAEDDPARSLRELERAAELFTEEGNAVQAATAHLYRAEMLALTGETDEAIRLAAAARETFASRGMEVRAAWADLVSAGAFARAGDDDALERHLDAAANRERHPHVPWLDSRIHLLRGRLLDRRGDTPAARAELTRAVELVEEMRATVGGDELRTAFLADKLAAYEDMVLACLADGDVEDALAYVERSKSRALVDLLAGHARPATADEANRALIDRLDEMRGDLNYLYNRMNRLEGEGTQRSLVLAEGLRSEILGVEREVSRILRRIETRAPDLAALERSVRAPANVADLVGPGTAILEYFQIRDRILAFVVRDGRVRLRATHARAREVEQLVERLSFQLTKFNFGAGYVAHHRAQLRPATDAILAELHDLLLAPVRDALGDVDLMVIPHGILHSVPFHALLSADGYLIEEREVSVAPSASVLGLCLAREAEGRDRPLLMGVPDENTPHIREELRGIQGEVKGCRVLLGPRATLTALRRHAENARTIHLATHGVFREDNPAFSAIRLSDTWLGLFDIYGLRVGAELVTLSACETGLAKILGGDELIGLARGFFAAGTPTVMVSLWRVNDRSTAEFMQSFYRSLDAGKSPAGSMRAASLQTMKRYDHPYFWAPFSVVGRPGRSGRGGGVAAD